MRAAFTDPARRLCSRTHGFGHPARRHGCRGRSRRQPGFADRRAAAGYETAGQYGLRGNRCGRGQLCAARCGGLREKPLRPNCRHDRAVRKAEIGRGKPGSQPGGQARALHARGQRAGLSVYTQCGARPFGFDGRLFLRAEAVNPIGCPGRDARSGPLPHYGERREIPGGSCPSRYRFLRQNRDLDACLPDGGTGHPVWRT